MRTFKSTISGSPVWIVLDLVEQVVPAFGWQEGCAFGRTYIYYVSGRAVNVDTPVEEIIAAIDGTATERPAKLTNA